MIETWALNSIEELIHRRRRQVLVHSILYYRMDTNIIDDATFSAWASELATLQILNPTESLRVHYHHKAFMDFTGETGYNLPLDDPRATAVARMLLKNEEDIEE